MHDVSEAESELIRSCLESMGRDPRTLCTGRRLAGGSGSAVYRLTLADADDDVILKVTTAPDWRSRARRELRFHTDLGPDVPVGVPSMLGKAISDHHVCLLLSMAQPTTPPATWPAERWIELGTRLGALHHPETFEKADRAPWLERRSPVASEDAVEPALAYWTSVDHGSRASALLEQRQLLADAVLSVPRCLIHGDCHPDNLLVDDRSTLVFSDWQEAGIGHGPEDLAMLWQRAEADGANPPRAAMLRAYARARGDILDASLRRAVTAAELLLLLLQWPSHLARAGRAERDVLVRRLGLLGDEWAGTTRAW